MTLDGFFDALAAYAAQRRFFLQCGPVVGSSGLYAVVDAQGRSPLEVVPGASQLSASDRLALQASQAGYGGPLRARLLLAAGLLRLPEG